MAKKDFKIALPDDTDSSFEDDHFILTYRPKINFVEPDQEALPEKELHSVSDDELSVDSLRGRTQKLVSGLKAIAKLADLAQKRIDARVKASGGLTIKLDEKRDAITIAAMKRRFPDKEDPTEITYEDYKEVIDCVHKHAPQQSGISFQDIKTAQASPNKTDFGGFSNQQGENRPELSSMANVVEPLDLKTFQKNGVLSLFNLMLPLIKKQFGLP